MSAEQNPLYPIFLKLDKVPVLIVGGGAVALEKLSFLLKSSPNATVTLVAPDFLPEIVDLAAQYDCILHNRPFGQDDLLSCRLLLVATADAMLNAEIAQAGRAKGLLVNVADTPELCDFYLGGIVRKGPIKLAISTLGLSPTLAKRIRQFLEQALPDELIPLASNLNKLRARLKGLAFAQKVQALDALTAQLVAEENKGCGQPSCPFQNADTRPCSA